MEVYLHHFLTSVLDGGEWLASRPGRFTPGEKPLYTHSIEDWMNPRFDLAGIEKRNIPWMWRELNPVVQPLAHP
jgi:hypothetical protein